MGYLLPILEQLIKDHDSNILDPDPESDIIKLFR